ncbi:hypothetical protein [Streptomyces sp. NBC_00691]|uniref:hypothetical protein n=1 Tax=Streptomyces sp. NBC_00691 TaxID=2903671 RepID=UPI002E30A027|nr:hypothetical protein [Streptomyces sp. NBC_00691]
MTRPQPLTRSALADDIARAARNVPGVAFLRPGLSGLLRDGLRRPSPAAAASSSSAGVRVHGGDRTSPLRVEVRLVVLRSSRTVDVARAVRSVVEARLAALLPGRTAGAARVSVTVTGLV